MHGKAVLLSVFYHLPILYRRIPGALFECVAEIRCRGVADEQLEALLDAAVRGGALRRVRTINQYAYTIS